jgi:hypothetical protein
MKSTSHGRSATSPATKEIPATTGSSSCSAAAGFRLAPCSLPISGLALGGSLGTDEARSGSQAGTERNRAAESGSLSSWCWVLNPDVERLWLAAPVGPVASRSKDAAGAHVGQMWAVVTTFTVAPAGAGHRRRPRWASRSGRTPLALARRRALHRGRSPAPFGPVSWPR